MRNCWQKFDKEHGTKDPWEVVKMVKVPWGSKSRMKTLKDLDGKVIEEEDRAKALEEAHFLWHNRAAEEEEEDSREDAPGFDREELKYKILDPLSRTSNMSAPEPDRISYKIIMWANKSALGEGAQDSTSTRCALGTSSRVLRMPTESGDVIRYVFLQSAGLRQDMLDVGGGGRPVVSSWDFVRYGGW